jgi:hypothetical protein
MAYYLVELEPWEDGESLGTMDHDGFHQVKAKADVTDIVNRAVSGTQADEMVKRLS